MNEPTLGSPLLWVSFAVLIIAVLIIDLGLFQKKSKVMTWKSALIWTLIWVSLAIAFNLFVYFKAGHVKAMEFTAGYVIEQALSVDNIFVFIIIFSFFAVPQSYQHRILFWGVLGAMILRAIFVFLGAILIERFHWITYIFGGFLIYTGMKTMFSTSEEMDPGENPVVKIFKRFIPMTEGYMGERFWVKSNGKWLATPLLLVLIVIEATDVVFAVDSVPAVFAVSHDPFIVYTSNIFAILGLRSMFFLLSNAMQKVRYLKVGLGFILSFVGLKMLVNHYYKVPILLSLGVILGIIVLSVMLSLLIKAKDTSAT